MAELKLPSRNGRSAPRVMIGVPTYENKLGSYSSLALHAAVSELSQVGYQVHLQILGNDPFIDRARNLLLTVFLHHPECTHLFMLDDDVGPEHGSWRRLLEFDKEFVGGLYPAKRDAEMFMLRYLERGKVAATPETGTGLLKVESLPGGFICLKRSMVERMTQHYHEQTWFEDDTGYSPNGISHNLFWHGVIERRWWGEDFLFCERWRQIGGEIFLDPWLKFKHTGTKTWEGCFGTTKQRERLELVKKYKNDPEGLQKELQELFSGRGWNQCEEFNPESLAKVDAGGLQAAE